MAEELILSQNTTKAQRYQELLPQIRAVIGAEKDRIANLANTAAMLKEAFGFFWVGFYLMKEGELVLGPFQGPLACTRIALGKGVCGTAAQQQKTILVPDVEAFPGHIACSSDSKSEIVLPLVIEGKVKMVLDVDSDVLDDFDSTDQKYLEELMEALKTQF
ncbi:MAG: GAF domain-containing protein [Bacteroidota bacterium]